MRVFFPEVLRRIELDAMELECRRGQNAHSLGETMLLDHENGERGGLALTGRFVRVMHACE